MTIVWTGRVVEELMSQLVSDEANDGVFIVTRHSEDPIYVKEDIVGFNVCGKRTAGIDREVRKVLCPPIRNPFENSNDL